MHRFRKSKRAQTGQDPVLETSFSGPSPVSPAFPSPSIFQYPEQPSPPPQAQFNSISTPPTPSRISADPPSIGPLPRIQPNDFRASVILPEISEQFPVLRPGTQITVESLKGRFAEQRAREAANRITEEEEEMILDALRFRSRGHNNSQKSQETLPTNVPDDQYLASTSNTTASPSSSRSKRYSNNLFGSGRLRDYTYMRSVTSRSKTSLASSNTASSVTPTEASFAAGRVNSMTESTTSSTSLRPMTPEGTTSISSIVSSTQANPPRQEAGSMIGSRTSITETSDEGSRASTSSHAISTAAAIEHMFANKMDPIALKRTSLAVQDAIKELEDEGEDEIVLPRSRTPRGVIDDASDLAQRASYSSFEAGVAVTADKQIPSGSEEHRTSPLPSRILPGYIPGMNRPMTPRDFDLDDRSHSTTPRATSPAMNVFQTDSISSLSSVASQTGAGLLRKESISAATVRQSTRPGTPSLFLQRSPSTNGRHTPEAQEAIRRSTSGGDQSIELESPSHSSLLSRRRPISPLSNLAATASNTAATGSATSSRPSTPSNVIWQPSLSGSMGTMKSMHTRSESWQSDASGNEIIVVPNGAGGSAGRVGQTTQRTVRSTPLPDSPTTGQNTFTNLAAARVATPPPDRTQAVTNGVINIGNGSSVGGGGGDIFSSNRSQRSPTPTPNAPRSPSSPAFGFVNGGSRRSSRQTATSPWGFSGTSYGPPMLNLFGNDSRTSIGSTGSSYHSWDGDKDDREWYDQILSGEEPPPAWHDLRVGRTESPLSEDVAEELLRKYFGLTITDISAIQDKLVTFAASKGDGGRKRRPSTSQSNYVPPARVISPPPQIVQVPPSPPATTPVTSEQYSQKANALLDSVVSDIQAKHPPPPPPPLDTSSIAVQKGAPSDPSPGTKRNHSLADVLFGPNDNRSPPDPQSEESDPAPDSSVIGTPVESKQGSVVNEGSVQTLTESQAESQAATTSASPSGSSVSQPALRSSQTPSPMHVPTPPKDEADLVREFHAKMAQADATLRSASRSRLPGETLIHSGTITRKRIDASQIGSPQLLSHSNPPSLEGLQTIPSRSPTLSTSHNSPTSKIGSRFKKLRGTLRVKQYSSLSEEIADSSVSSSSPANVKSPMSSQTASYDPAKLRTPGHPALASATESGRSKVSIPSPPASAGPGLKGFISRFRGKQRASEPPPAADKRLSPQLVAHPPPLSPISPRYQETSNIRTPAAAEPGPGASTPKSENTRQNIVPSPAPMESMPLRTHTVSPSAGSRQSVMIQQLFDAANNLGLDENALNDLLMRSGSISTHLTKSARVNPQRSNSRQGQRNETPTILEQSISGDASQLTIQPPSPANPRPSQATPEPGATRPLTLIKPPEQARRARENHGDRTASTVVRRTIILPENIKVVGPDAQNALHRTNSGKRRRASVNSGSLKDRAPTPPPPRSPAGQRFSNDGSPPVPSLPPSLSPDIYLTAPRNNLDKSNSTYDSSIYEMYANESRVQSAFGMEPHAADNSPGQSGPALEFIEYANGETIWSIVSGLRGDEDDGSIYNGRTSFASEYSTGGQGGQDWDQLQVTVRENARSASRGSYSSFALKNKEATQSKARPETKVFYGSSTQIGRLIENLSQGMDSGSFNFSPGPTRHGHSATGHSPSSSLSTNHDLSMEERLEQLLGSISRGS